jgi:rsbT antagonist protein RsbS
MIPDTRSGEPAFVPIQLVRGVVIATAQSDLTDAAIRRLSSEILGRLQHREVYAVIIDVSAVSVIDRREFTLLCDALIMASMMGARTVLVGLAPGVAAALALLDVDSHRIAIASSLEAGLAMMAAL